MLRPCFLVVEREQFASISTRKLVIETAKFNVITAYTSSEAIEAAHKFPNVDGIVLDAGMGGISCGELHRQLQKAVPGVPIIVIGNSQTHPCPGESQRLESFDPTELLDVLKRIDPARTAVIVSREDELDKTDK